MTTLRQMRFLVALADTRNFSRAAEQCHVTQSTLSSGLKEMEGQLGIKVAERTTHSVLMTPEGSELANRARDILARVGDFEDFVWIGSEGDPCHFRCKNLKRHYKVLPKLGYDRRR